MVLRPSNTEQISEIVKYCYKNNLAISPIGGNTGLVGGSVPVFDEIVISLERMNKIINIDNISGIITCEAGIVLEQLNQQLNENDPPFMVPLDLGAKGTCQIGGNISTNAGGLRYLRYGSLHGNVLGLEVVLPNGEILDLNQNLRKDNTGYDLKQLFIGAEGTLGIVTKCTILCPNLPKSRNVALFQLENYEMVLELFKLAKQNLSEILSAFEFFDHDSRKVIEENLKVKNPFSLDKEIWNSEKSSEMPFYVVLETSGSNFDHDQEKLYNFIETASNKNVILDGILAENSTQMENLWNLRERIAEAFNIDGYVFKYDLSIKVTELYNVVEALRKHIEEKGGEAGKNILRLNGYGHIGDGNLHINASVAEYDREVEQILEPFIYHHVSSLKGSVSAEHGLGFKKPKYIYLSKPKNSVDIMKNIKDMFDPKGIMNPYKVLPDN